MAVAASEGVPREPKYYVVKRHLLELIATLPPGSLVPTERLLTAELVTSRTTVRRALSELVGEGRLVRRQGSGTYVAEPKISWPLQMTSFTEQAAAAGYSASVELLEAGRTKASEEVAERLAVRPGASVYLVERLRLVDGAPMAVETSQLSASRFPGLLKELRRGTSLYKVLNDSYGVVPVAAEETIETAAASPREAELLGTDTGSPMLVLSAGTASTPRANRSSGSAAGTAATATPSSPGSPRPSCVASELGPAACPQGVPVVGHVR